MSKTLRPLKHMRSIPVYKQGTKDVAIAMKVVGVKRRVWKKRLRRHLSSLPGWICTFHKNRTTGKVIINLDRNPLS
jgi:hypothetical protein